MRLGTISSRRETKIRILGRRPPPAAERTLGNCATTTTFLTGSDHHRPSDGVCRSGGRRQHRRSARMLQTVARGTYFGSPGAGAEEGQPLRWRHRSSAARGEPSGAQRSRERRARIRHGCRAHAARRKRQMGEEVGSLSALQGCQRCERTLALFSGLARRGGEPNVNSRTKERQPSHTQPGQDRRPPRGKGVRN